MKYLATICLTAISIALITNVAWVINTDIREYSRIRIETFRAYAREKARANAPQAQKQSGPPVRSQSRRGDLGPQVEIPTEKLEKL